MPWIRTRPGGEDDVVIQIRSRIWWTLWLAYRWTDYSTVLSAVNKLDWEIIELIEKLRKKLADRMALAEAAHDEYRETQKYTHDKFGISETFFLDEKLFKERVKPYTARPDGKQITSFLNPLVIRDYRLNNKPVGKDNHSNTQRRAGNHDAGRPIIPGQSGQMTAYTLPEFADKSIHLAEETGVDQVISFREQPKGGNKDDPERVKKLQRLRNQFPKKADESKEDWNNRLNRMMDDDI